MVDSFYTLMGVFDNTYFNILVFGICSIIVVYVFTTFALELNIII